METFLIFGKGVLTGILFGVPIGVIGMLTIQRTNEKGFFGGLCTGISSSFSDVFYVLITTLGLSFISEFLLKWQTHIRLVGCILILCYGTFVLIAGNRSKQSIFTTTPQAKKDISSKGKVSELFTCFITTLPVALSNPTSIILYTTAFVTLGIRVSSVKEAIFLALGVFMGSACWWIALSALVAKLHEKLSPKFHKMVNTISGIILILLAVIIAITTLA